MLSRSRTSTKVTFLFKVKVMAAPRYQSHGFRVARLWCRLLINRKGPFVYALLERMKYSANYLQNQIDRDLMREAMTEIDRLQERVNELEKGTIDLERSEQGEKS